MIMTIKITLVTEKYDNECNIDINPKYPPIKIPYKVV